MFVECQIPTILQAVDRTTSENTKAVQETVLRSLAGLKDVCKAYPLYVHEVTTDKYAANLRAEKMLSHGGITSHYTCDIHKLAAVQTRTLSYVPGHISAMIAGALALGDSRALNGLRKSLGNVLDQRVKLLYGEPPDDPFLKSYRDSVHRICRTSCEAKFRSVCMCRGVSSLFLNDDWQDTDNLCFWCSRPGVTRENVLLAMARFLVPSLLPGKPPMFHRSKWTHFEGSYEFSGLLALCHGLLKAIMVDYLGTTLVAEPSSTAAPAAQQAAEPLQDAGAEPDVDPGQDQGRATDDGPNPDTLDGADFQKEMDVLTDNIDWKAVN